MANKSGDDFLSGPVPAPDAEPSAAERAHAKTFAGLVDKTLEGHAPPALSADDRALLEVATVIRAASGKAQLPEAVRRSAIEDALRAAVGERKHADAPRGGDVVAFPGRAAARAGKRGFVPWLVAGASTAVAAAAVIALAIHTPQVVRVPAAASAAVPEAWRSRPADPLVGPIAREAAGDASARLDTIFADRLDGFRDRTLAGRAR